MGRRDACQQVSGYRIASWERGHPEYRRTKSPRAHRPASTSRCATKSRKQLYRRIAGVLATSTADVTATAGRRLAAAELQLQLLVLLLECGGAGLKVGHLRQLLGLRERERVHGGQKAQKGCRRGYEERHSISTAVAYVSRCRKQDRSQLC